MNQPPGRFHAPGKLNETSRTFLMEGLVTKRQMNGLVNFQLTGFAQQCQLDMQNNEKLIEFSRPQ